MRILVIEDTPVHIEDAKNFFSGHPDVEVHYVSDYDQALDCINPPVGRNSDEAHCRRLPVAGGDQSEPRVDGVISDIFFPFRSMGPLSQPEPIGAAIMMICRELNLPCVLNTSGYHHGSRYQWICTLQRSFGLPEIIDGADSDVEAQHKNWSKAFRTLSNLIAEQKKS